MAQATVNLTANKFAYVDKDSPSTVINISSIDSVLLTRYADKTIKNYFFVGFNGLSSSLKNNRIYSVEAVFHTDTTGGAHAGLVPSAGGFSPSTLTWSNRPDRASFGGLWLYESFSSSVDDNPFTLKTNEGSGIITDEDRSAFAVLLLKSNTAQVFCSSYPASGSRLWSSTRVYKKLNNGTSDPYIKVTYDNSVMVKSKITPKNCPIGGYVNPREARSFSWTFEKDDIYSCVGGFTQASASLFWKESSEGTWNEVVASTTNVTVPANEFPENSTIEWYLSGTDTAGTSSTTITYSFSTSAAAVVVSPRSPVNTIEDGSSAITFGWDYSTEDGFEPTAVTMKWSSDNGTHWTTVLDNDPWVTSYSIAANTFPAGQIMWAVQGYNVDGIAGDLSYASFISVAAPIVYTVNATEVPFSTITWQASEQQSFEIDIDGKRYGPYFGTEKSFTAPEYLTDGRHVIRLRVLGGYGLWSEWLELTVDIENVPGESITVLGYTDKDVALTFETEEETLDFYIYRDKVLIGHTNYTEFRDSRAAHGPHSYYVVNRLPDGNYSVSGIIEQTITLKNAVIAPLNSGGWIELVYKLKSQSDPSYEESVETEYNHLSSNTFPSANISVYQESALSYSTVFLAGNDEDHAQFRALWGTPVIIKIPDGKVVIGVLNAWSRMSKVGYYTSYTFTIRQIQWEDFVDDTQ